MIPPPPRSTLFPYTTLFRSDITRTFPINGKFSDAQRDIYDLVGHRSEEHTSELQSRENLVCRLLLEKKKKKRRQLPSKIHQASYTLIPTTKRLHSPNYGAPH